jgi:hypothetical protein
MRVRFEGSNTVHGLRSMVQRGILRPPVPPLLTSILHSGKTTFEVEY